MDGVKLFKYAVSGRPHATEDLLLNNPLPRGRFEGVDLSEFVASNPSNRKIEGSRVWFPAGAIDRVKSCLDISVLTDVTKCNIMFFQKPNAQTEIKLTVQGGYHKVMLMSRRNISLSLKLVWKDFLAIGEDTYIGGGRLVMSGSEVVVGAGGLWSDGVLVQATNGHGIVDLETMEIVNGRSSGILLGRRVWLGRNCTVMKGVQVGNGSIVSTGAIVTRDVPDACAVAGVPAKVVRERVSWSLSQKAILDQEREEMNKLRSQFGSV